MNERAKGERERWKDQIRDGLGGGMDAIYRIS